MTKYIQMHVPFFKKLVFKHESQQNQPEYSGDIEDYFPVTSIAV